MTTEAAERLRHWVMDVHQDEEMGALLTVALDAEYERGQQSAEQVHDSIRAEERRAGAADAVERIRERLNITDDTPYYHDREVSRIRRILDEEAAR
jgi:hypothetical protein